MVSLFPPLPPHRNFPLRINIKYVRQQDKNLEIAKGFMRRSRIPLLFINSQLMSGRQVLEVDSYGEEVSYEANCNENQI
jgi:hypothetical protein